MSPIFCLLPFEYSRNFRDGSTSRRAMRSCWYAMSTPPRRFAKYSIVCPPVSLS